MRPRVLQSGGEFPAKEQIYGLGELMFLYMRAPIYQAASVAQLRSVLQPAIDTGNFAVMRQDHVPRGVITFALVDTEAEQKLISGALLTSEEWTSGDRVWLLDLVAPYGHGSAARLMRFWHDSLPKDATHYQAQRYGKSRDAVRRFTGRRLPNGRWGARVWKDPYTLPEEYR